jgi:hypothetical protein
MPPCTRWRTLSSPPASARWWWATATTPPGSSRSATSWTRSPRDGTWATTPASAFAATTLVWCDADATVAEAAVRMMECWIRHILVERAGRLVGVVSARDLLGAYITGDVAER